MTARPGDKEKSPRHNSENRRANKPLMEKRRRARINQSLCILKTIVVDTNKIEGSHKHAKLEKADILELTVKHLQSLQNFSHQSQPTANTNNSAATTTKTTTTSATTTKFQQGFDECTREVASFLASASVDKNVAANLIDHLRLHKGELSANYEREELSPFSPVSSSRTISSPSPCPSIKSSQDSQDFQHLPISIINPSSNSSNSINDLSSRSPLQGDTAAAGIQIIPTRLPNGQVVFLLPGSSHAKYQDAALSIPVTRSTVVTPTNDDTTLTMTATAWHPDEPLDFRKPAKYLMTSNEDEDCALDLCKRSNQVVPDGDSVWRPW